MRKVFLIAVGIAALAVALVAQGQGAPPDGTTQALVTELRALRADLNRITGASIRTQLLVGRLQLQEQRILTLSRQMADVQKDMAGVVQVRTAMEGQFKQMEADPGVRAEDREAHARAVEGMREQVAVQRSREQQLREQESLLAGQVAEEQARWTDFSSRLDELERALIARPR